MRAVPMQKQSQRPPATSSAKTTRSRMSIEARDQPSPTTSERQRREMRDQPSPRRSTTKMERSRNATCWNAMVRFLRSYGERKERRARRPRAEANVLSRLGHNRSYPAIDVTIASERYC